jgi:hypothetical protein
LIVWERPPGCGLFLRAPNPGQLSNNTFNNTSAAFGVSSIALPPCSFGCHYFSPFPYIASETAGGFTARNTSETCHTLMMQKMQQEIFVVPPMDCKSVETPPAADDWQY